MQKSTGTVRRQQQAAFHKAARDAGHQASYRTWPAGGGGRWVEFTCACERYTSQAGTWASARRSWVAHARRALAGQLKGVAA